MDELKASMKSSVLWHHEKKTLLTFEKYEMMLSRKQSSELSAEQLLKLGEERSAIDEEQFLTVNQCVIDLILSMIWCNLSEYS